MAAAEGCWLGSVELRYKKTNFIGSCLQKRPALRGSVVMTPAGPRLDNIPIFFSSLRRPPREVASPRLALDCQAPTRAATLRRLVRVRINAELSQLLRKTLGANALFFCANALFFELRD